MFDSRATAWEHTTREGRASLSTDKASVARARPLSRYHHHRIFNEIIMDPSGAASQPQDDTSTAILRTKKS